MSANIDLVGKTISGVIATRDPRMGKTEIWMLQFTDGTHVEFVSPKAKKALRRAANRSRTMGQSAANELSQLSLNVA